MQEVLRNPSDDRRLGFASNVSEWNASRIDGI